MESWLFLALVLLIAIFGHNSSLIIATVVVMALKLIPYTAKWLPLIQHKGINWGVTVISVAILIPIATGQIGFNDLWAGLQSAWVLQLPSYRSMASTSWQLFRKLRLP